MTVGKVRGEASKDEPTRNMTGALNNSGDDTGDWGMMMSLVIWDADGVDGDDSLWGCSMW